MPIPKSPRDILLYSSRILHEVITPSGLQFVTLYNEGYHLFTYNKELLIEKKIDKDYAENTIYAKLFSSLISFHVFSKDDLDLLKTIPEANTKVSEMVIGVKLISQFYGDFHILLFLDKLTHYDYIHKLLLMLARLTEEKLRVYESSRSESELWQVHEHLENYLQIGLLKIEKGYITYIDDIAKSVFEIDSTYVPFEVIQDHFTNKKLYLDHFLINKEVLVQYELSNNRSKWIRFISKEIDFHLYLFIEDITKEICDKDAINVSLMHQLNSPLLSLNALKDTFEEYHHSTTLIYFVPESMEQVLQNIAYSFRNKLESSFETIFSKIAKEYFIGIYSSNDSGWLLFIKTIDKRVITRIFLELQKEINLLPFVDTYLKLKGIAVQIQKKHPFSEILEMINANYYEHCKNDGIIFYDRKMTTNHHLMNTIAYNLNQMLQGDEMLLEYHPVGNWENKKIEYYQVELHKSLLLGEKDLFEKTIIYEGIASLFDKLVLKSMIKQSKSWSKEFIKDNHFAIEIHLPSFLNNSFMEDVIKRLKKSQFELENIIFVITVDKVNITEIFNQILKFKEYNIGFGLIDIGKLPLSMLHELQHIDYIYINPVDIDFIKGLKLEFTKMVFCHYDNTIKKSELEQYHINYIKGSFFPPVESF
jgi:EAL domain-containing protein (putative c-di-GMP-specific phosphodiesterase class I)